MSTTTPRATTTTKKQQQQQQQQQQKLQKQLPQQALVQLQPMRNYTMTRRIMFFVYIVTTFLLTSYQLYSFWNNHNKLLINNDEKQQETKTNSIYSTKSSLQLLLSSSSPLPSHLNKLIQLSHEVERDERSYNSTSTAYDTSRTHAIEFVIDRMKHYELYYHEQQQQQQQQQQQSTNLHKDISFWKRWRMRGVGYLYWYWNMILIAEVISTEARSEPGQLVVGRKNVVRIRNVLSDHITSNSTGSSSSPSNFRTENCHLWTLYVRVNGPEIFAGSAFAVSSSSPISNDYNGCYWEFPFVVQIPGIYKVDTRILYYNATSLMESHCSVTTSQQTQHQQGKEPLNETTIRSTTSRISTILLPSSSSNSSSFSVTGTVIRKGFKGFKMYSPDIMCCEICSRLSPDCLYWGTPPIGLKRNRSDRTNNGCDLYFYKENDGNQSHFHNSHERGNHSFEDDDSGYIPPESRFVQNEGYDIFIISSHNTKGQQRQSFQTHSMQLDRQEIQKQLSVTIIQQQRDNLNQYESHGPSHPDGRPLYFAGCGWSFWMSLDYPCLNGTLDDQIPVFILENRVNNNGSNVVTSEFSVVSDVLNPLDDAEANTTTAVVIDLIKKYENLPLCTIEAELPENHVGRWVRAPMLKTSTSSSSNNTLSINTNEEVTCSIPVDQYDPNYSEFFSVTLYDRTKPECYYREDISVIGHYCTEMNCRFINQENDLWESDLHKKSNSSSEYNWYGYWYNYNCQYLYHITNEQLQQCVYNRKITSFNVFGASIAEYLRTYLNQRLDGIILYNTTSKGNTNSDVEDSGGIEIHLSTLAMLHHNMNDLRSIVENMPDLSTNISAATEGTKNTNMKEFYWLNSVFISSEREQEARGPVQVIKSEMVRSILQKKGYHMINFYDVSTAFTYDSATQKDGMHIIGPPMKVVIAKLFHYVCKDTLKKDK